MRRSWLSDKARPCQSCRCGINKLMKYLFLLAHPDDEVVSAGGTIRRLVDRGDEVKVVMVTKGEAGKGADKRIKEFEKSCKILGIKEHKFLDYRDGEICNNQVWGSLELDLIDEIEEHMPEVVITFDHSGWYFHLDHVGVSIATMRAVQRSKHKVDALFFTMFHPPGIKIRWKYVYQDELPVTHEVNIKTVVKEKIKAVEAHESQKIRLVVPLRLGKMDREYFQLVLASKKGKKWFNKHEVFKGV